MTMIHAAASVVLLPPRGRLSQRYGRLLGSRIALAASHCHGIAASPQRRPSSRIRLAMRLRASSSVAAIGVSVL